MVICLFCAQRQFERRIRRRTRRISSIVFLLFANYCLKLWNRNSIKGARRQISRSSNHIAPSGPKNWTDLLSVQANQIYPTDLLSVHTNPIFPTDILSIQTNQIFPTDLLFVQTNQIFPTDLLSVQTNQIYPTDLLSVQTNQIYPTDLLSVHTNQIFPMDLLSLQVNQIARTVAGQAFHQDIKSLA